MSKLKNYYKQYAKRCLLAGKTNSKAFDNSFEDGYGDEVVLFLMRQATEILPPISEFLSEGLSTRDRRYKLIRKHENQARLCNAIKKGGTWDYWMHFLKHVTYHGFYSE